MARSLLTGILLVGLTGCGGGDSTSPPAPPPPPVAKPPAALELKSGDGQAAVPGTAVPVVPTVLVKDVDGRPVVGVAVSFAVDSGGGQVATPTATTDGSGIASSGGWTLGPAEVTNVLSASVTGVGSVKWRATGRYIDVAIADTVVAGSGGTIAYRKAGDPLDGLTVSIPATAYQGAQTWKLVSQRGVRVTFPAGVSQIGTAVSIANDQGYADSLLAVRLPIRVGPDTAIAAFFYDPTTKFLEMIPIAAEDSVSITVATTHFGSRFLWQPATSSQRAPIGSTVRAGFDPVTIIIAALPVATLLAPAESGFRPGVDDWEFTNYGTFITPEGTCLGMSVSAMYYYSRVKLAGGQSLSGHFDLVPGFEWDNPQGIRFAAMVQHRYEARADVAAAFKNRLAALAAGGRVSLDLLSYQSLVVALKATGRPQLFAMDQGPSTNGHAVVAYATSGGTVKLADPNQPGQAGVTATFTSGHFQPINLQPKASAAATSYNRVFVVGSSVYIPTALVDAEWHGFLDKQAGNGVFPATTFKTFDPLSASYQLLGDSVSVWADQVQFAVDCSICLPVLSLAKVDDRNGHPLDNPTPTADLSGRDSVGVRSEINEKFVDFRWALVESKRFELALVAPLAPDFPEPNTTTTFSARPFGKAPPGASYRWNFGDGTPVVTRAADSTITHVFATDGAYTVTVALTNTTGATLARVARRYDIGVVPVLWRLTQFHTTLFQTLHSIADLNGLVDAGGIHNSDHVTWFRSDSTLIVGLVANPSTGILVFLPRALTKGANTYRRGLYLQSDPAGTPGKPGLFDPSQTLIPLAVVPTGSYPGEPDDGIAIPAIDALMVSATDISGTAVVHTRDFTGLPASLVDPQKVRTLLAWEILADLTQGNLDGSIDRWQSVWVYLPASAAHGMYWYGKFHQELTFEAVRLP